MVEVIYTDEFGEWFWTLDDPGAKALMDAVDVLADLGVRLGFPRSSEIKGSGYALRELRVPSNGRPLRVFYAFDPKRQAVLLIGGDKTGQKRFYETMTPIAERIWVQYLAEQAAGEHEEGP